MRPIILWLLLCSSCFAQPTAVIEGPSQALAGDLVILSWGTSTGEAFKLIAPDSLKGKILYNTTDKQLGFSTRENGSYSFIMVAVSKELEIAHTIKTVQIGGFIPPPGPPPTDPPPVPVPPGTWDALKGLSRTSAAAINDPPTAQALATAINSVLPQIAAAPSLQEAHSLSTFTVESVLMARTGNSLKKDWLNGWRKPISQALLEAETQGRISTPALFADAMYAAAAGLVQ